jgi:DNA-binding protein HU-beta
MNKAEFIDAVASKVGLSKKDAKSAVVTVLETITETLAKKETIMEHLV